MNRWLVIGHCRFLLRTCSAANECYSSGNGHRFQLHHENAQKSGNVLIYNVITVVCVAHPKALASIAQCQVAFSSLVK